MEKQVPVCTVRKMIGANFNFHEYLLLGRSESHISLTFPPHKQIFMEIEILLVTLTHLILWIDVPTRG